MSSIGSRIRGIRGLESRASFAEKMGIGTATLQRYETDERSPDLEFLFKLKEITGYSLDYLAYGKESSLVTDEALLLERYRLLDSATKNKILLILLENNGATESVVNQYNNTGKGDQNNAKIQNINNAPSTTKKTKIKIGKQHGDVVNGDKNVNN